MHMQPEKTMPWAHVRSLTCDAGTVLLRETPLRAPSVMELVRAASDCGALDQLCGASPRARVGYNHFVDDVSAHPAGGCLLFRRISMLNHSCAPNASIHLADGELT